MEMMHYFETFAGNPINLIVVALSFMLAIACIVFIKRTKLSPQKKIILMYAHIFLLIFPLIYFAFNFGCQTPLYNCDFKLMVYAIPTLLLGAAFLAITMGYIIMPKMILKAHTKLNDRRLNDFTANQAELNGIKAPPSLYIIDKAEPVAYSMSSPSPSIFLSVGLLDVMSKKEIEAVLLHELGHLKNKASLFKFSTTFLQVFSPLSYFTNFSCELTTEEKRADNFVINTQKTEKHLISAKNKLDAYCRFIDM